MYYINVLELVCDWSFFSTFICFFFYMLDLPVGGAVRWLCKVSGVHSMQGCCNQHFPSWSSALQTYRPVLWSKPLFCLCKANDTNHSQKVHREKESEVWTLVRLLILYLLFDIESFGGALARPLTPAVREGSELELLVWAPSLPQVLGLRLAKKEDLGDWVLVGLLAVKNPGRVGALSMG